MKISVFIPTSCQIQDLHRCLEALKKQCRLPDEVVLTVRDTDRDTHNFLASYDVTPLSLVIAEVNQPGPLAANQLGYQTASGDIIAITAAAATPKPDWLAKIADHYLANSHANQGSNGSRDLLYQSPGSAQACVCYF